MNKAVVIAYINKTGELLGCHKNCIAWGVRYFIDDYVYFIETKEGSYNYAPCNLLHINTPEALKRAEKRDIYWWQLYLKNIPKLKDALIKEGIIHE